MDSLEFQRLIAVLGELTGVQPQTVAAMLSGDGDLAEVTAMIEARFAAQAVCPQCQSGNIGSWAWKKYSKCAGLIPGRGSGR